MEDFLEFLAGVGLGLWWFVFDFWPVAELSVIGWIITGVLTFILIGAWPLYITPAWRRLRSG